MSAWLGSIWMQQSGIVSYNATVQCLPTNCTCVLHSRSPARRSFIDDHIPLRILFGLAIHSIPQAAFVLSHPYTSVSNSSRVFTRLVQSPPFEQSPPLSLSHIATRPPILYSARTNLSSLTELNWISVPKTRINECQVGEVIIIIVTCTALCGKGIKIN